MYRSFLVCFFIVVSQATAINVAIPDLPVFEATVEYGCRNSTCSIAIQMRNWLISLNEKLFNSVTEHCKQRCCADTIPDYIYMNEINKLRYELTEISREIAAENEMHKKSWPTFHPLMLNATLNFKQARDILSLASSKECQCGTVDCTPEPEPYAEFFAYIDPLMEAGVIGQTVEAVYNSRIGEYDIAPKDHGGCFWEQSVRCGYDCPEGTHAVRNSSTPYVYDDPNEFDPKFGGSCWYDRVRHFCCRAPNKVKNWRGTWINAQTGRTMECEYQEEVGQCGQISCIGKKHEFTSEIGGACNSFVVGNSTGMASFGFITIDGCEYYKKYSKT